MFNRKLTKRVEWLEVQVRSIQQDKPTKDELTTILETVQRLNNERNKLLDYINFIAGDLNALATYLGVEFEGVHVRSLVKIKKQNAKQTNESLDNHFKSK